MKEIYLGVCLLLNVLLGYSQPANIDFNGGNINGWTFEQGTNIDSYLMSTSGYSPSTQYTVLAAGATEMNSIPLTMTSPLGGNYTKIGYYGGYTNRLKQTFRVDAAFPAIAVSYAIVLEEGGSHACNEDPYFYFVLKDSLGDIIGNSNSYYMAVGSSCSSGDPSFMTFGNFRYKNWISSNYSLQDYIGTNITVEFIASGCALGGHSGYAYLDADMCNNSFSQNVLAVNTATYNLLQSQNNILVCGTTTANIEAPPGATSYSWTGPGISGLTTQSVSVTQAGTYSLVFDKPSACSNTTSVSFTVGANPTVSISSTSSSVCLNAAITMTASGATNYTWTPYPGTGDYFSTELTIYPNASATYTVNGRGSNGCIGNAQYTVNIAASPSLAVTGNTNVCFGNSTILTGTGADTYTWAGGVTTPTILITPTVTSNYNVTGKITSTGCTQSLMSQVIVNGNVSITPAVKKICMGDSILITATGAASYTWTTGANTNTVSLKPTTTTSYTLFWETPACGTYSTAFTVTVNPLPNLSITNSNPVCSGKPISVSATFSSSTTYTWSNGATISSTNYTTSASSVPYTFTCSVSATNSLSCKNTATTSITVNPSPVLAQNFPTSLCSGSSFTLNFSGANTYTVNATSLAGSTLNITPTVTTNYTLTGKDAASCTSSLVASVLVNTGPPSNILTTTSYTVSQGSSFYLNLSSTGDTYTTTAPYTSYNVAGKYFICGPITATTTQVYSVTGTNICGTTTITFEVVPAPTNSISQGQIWGMTYQGGDNNAGTIFTTDASGNNHQVEYSFPNYDGSYGVNSLMKLSNGKYYGSTYGGGINGHGTLFEYDVTTNAYTKKFDFDRTPFGISPTGALLQASDGMIYGTTGQGGIYDEGVLFQFDPVTGIYTKKYEFSASVSGGGPNGSLVQDTDGKIYGTTSFGGTSGYGVIFQFDPITNIFAKKFDFALLDGNKPNGSLFKFTDGMFYGTTESGGTNNTGVIFQYNPLTSTFTKKYEFVNASGSIPKSALMQVADGRVFGVASTGGSNNGGVIFQYDPASNVYSMKYDIVNASVDGHLPENTLTQALDGKLYSVTFYGGPNNLGVLFQYDPNTNAYVKKMDFTSATGRSRGVMTQAPDGKLYYFTEGGVAGRIVQYDPVTNVSISKIEFGSAPNGKNPMGKLTRAANGKLYGMTLLGGSSNLGVLFEYDPNTHTLSKKVDFTGTVNGSRPNGSLLLASDGKLYGMTELGGASAQGVLFQFDPVTNTYNKKIDFVAATKGSSPKGTLMQASNGQLYGMTSGGGVNNKGIIFQYDLSSQVLTKKIDFAGANGQNPCQDLIEAPDGKFYALTLSGGNYLGSGGTLFQYDPGANSLVRKFDFSNLAINGFGPYGSLVKANDGKLYGVTSLGGQNNSGLIFQYDMATDAYTIKKDFSTLSDGYSPMSTLLAASNGKLYGTTRGGGASNRGVVYEYDPATAAFVNKVNFNSINGDISQGSLIEIGIAVNTSSVSNSTQCIGGSIPVPYSLSGSFNSGNVFTAQLSDMSGSFSSPTNIGSVASTTPSVINATIPGSITSGTGYRIRVVSSSPVVIGSDNGADLTLIALPLPTITVNSGTICSTKSFTLTPGGGVSYNFLNAAGIVSPTVTATYTVIGTDANGCAGAATSTVSVLTPSIILNGGNICSGQSFTFTPTGALSYTYSSGSSIVSPSVTSTYTVTGLDANGCLGSATNYVTVTANPVVNTTASNSITCSSGTATLTASGAASYTWMPGSITGNTIATSPTVTTIYTITGTSGLCSNTKTLSVSVTGTMTLNASASNSVSCTIPTATLTASGATSYTWNPGNLTGNNIVVSPTVSTIYTVTGNSGSCTNTKTLSVSVNGTLTVNASASNSVSCANPTVTLIASGATSYTWSPGALTGSTIVVSPTVSTIYTITGTSGSCINTKTLSVNVSGTGLSLNTSMTNSITCATPTATLAATGATSYTWNPGALTGSTIVVSPTVSTIYTVTGMSGSCSATKTINVGVVPGFVLNAAALSSITCLNSIASCTASGASSYTWTGTGIVSGGFSSSLQVSAPGIYTVSGTSGSCIVTKTVSVLSDTFTPVVIVMGPNSLTCNTPTVQINLTTYSVTSAAFNWSGPSILSGSTTGTITVSAPGIYIYTVTNNSNGCSVINSVTVAQDLSVPVISISDATLTCQTSSVNLTASSNIATTDYQWLGAGIVSSPYSPTIIVNAAGNYSCIVTNTLNGCSATATTSVYLDVSSGFTVSVNSPSVCQGSSVVLTAIGATSYSWSTGANTSTINVQPVANTSYTVSGLNGSCTDTQIAFVTVNNTCQDVWPGDANSDGAADNIDVLELGLHYTQTGAPRAATSNNWQSYFANNWTGTISNGKNLNHSDCNGDGMINDDDTLAIFNNYGLTHTFKPVETTTVNPQLSIVPDQAAVVKGNWGTASVYLGDAGNTINNINGVAFTVDFDNSLIEPNSIYLEYQNSFIDASQNLYFRKLDFANAKLFTATTHTISNNVSGYGQIATLHYQIKSNLITDEVLSIGLSQAHQSDVSGTITPLTTGTETLMAIGASVGIKENIMNGNILISPNPTSGILNISFNSNPKNTKIELYNGIGALVLSEAMSDKSNTINTTGFSVGIYFIKVMEGNKIIRVQKVVKE